MNKGLLPAALLWLRNHYEEGSTNKRARRAVLDHVDAVLLRACPVIELEYLTAFFRRKLPMPSSEVMGKFKRGALHSGSKTGPKVTSRKQAVAIMMSEKRAENKHGGKYPEKKGKR